MVQELLPYLPKAISGELAAACVIALAAGLFLWACGAAWSRGLLTLFAVAIGGTLGMLLPRWQDWAINTMALSVLGAVFFGVSAFILPRLWVGLSLGVVLCAWVGLAVWMNFNGG